MPLGAARISLLAKSQVTAVAEVIRAKKDAEAFGNAQIDTAQYKFGGSSAKFDGAGDYLKPNVEYGWGSSQDFTWECWFRQDTNTQTYPVLFCNYESFGANDWGLFVDRANDNKLSLWVRNINTSAAILESTTTIADDTWYHVAITRSGSNWTMWVNGSSEDTTISSATIDASTRPLYIGMATSTSTSAFNGWIDEFRMSTTARYSSTFTPSTTPFVNDADTFILLHMDGTDGSTYFPDDNGSRSKIAITAVNDTQIDTAQSKFGNSSAYFDGVNDYLIIPGGPGADFSGDFTIEFWWWDDAINQSNLFDGRGVGNGYAGYDGNALIALANALLITNTSTGDFRVWIDGSDRSTAASGTLSASTWTHIAVQRSGGVFNAWVNGTRYVNYTGSKDYTQMFEQAMPIGANLASNGTSTANFPLKGNIDEFRISTVARYTNGSTITVPTEPFQNDSDTYLLLHMDGKDGNQDFEDDNGKGRSRVGVTAVGNAQVDTAQYKFGNTSAYFDGTGDYLSVENSAFAFGTDDFTIECWVRDVSTSNSGIFHLATTLFPANTNGLAVFARPDTGAVDWVVYKNGSSGTAIQSPDVVSGTWYHVALVRSSGTLKLYIDGTSAYSVSDTNNYTGTYLAIGGSYSTSFLMTGHIDEFRVSNSARYTANFTPDTELFQNDANTLLLLHMDGTDGSTTFRDDNGTY